MVNGTQRELCYDNAIDLFLIIKDKYERLDVPTHMPLAGEGVRPFAAPKKDSEDGPRELVGEGGDAPNFRVGDGLDDLRSLLASI